MEQVLGRVTAASGSRVTACLDPGMARDGFGRIGDMVKVRCAEREAVGAVSAVQVEPGSPPRFRIRLHGSNLSGRAGYELTGKMLDELPESEFRKQVRERWTEVAATGEPRHCDRNLHVFDRRSYHYESIVLPLSADGETVNMELVALIYRDA